MAKTSRTAPENPEQLQTVGCCFTWRDECRKTRYATMGAVIGVIITLALAIAAAAGEHIRQASLRDKEITKHTTEINYLSHQMDSVAAKQDMTNEKLDKIVNHITTQRGGNTP